MLGWMSPIAFGKVPEQKILSFISPPDMSNVPKPFCLVQALTDAAISQYVEPHLSCPPALWYTDHHMQVVAIIPFKVRTTAESG